MPVDTEESEFLLTKTKVFSVNGFRKVFAFSGVDNGCEEEDLKGNYEYKLCHVCGLWYVFNASLMVCIYRLYTVE